MRALVGLLLLGVVIAPCASAAVKKASAKAKEKRSLKRMPSALSAPEFVVFDENTSFEELLGKRERLGRRPSGFEVKARVIGIRRDIGLSNESDDASQRDIVLNAGFNEGISEGMVLTVKRKIPILDPYRDNAQRQLEIDFAKLKVVHVQDELSIARIASVDDIAKGLAVGLRSITIGDYVGTR